MSDLQLIYDGNKSNVYLEQQEGEAPVAIKMLKDLDPSSLLLAYMRNEFHITRELDIEGVRKALKEGKIEERPALYFEYVAGETLKEAFVRKQHSLRDKLKVSLRITRILDQIHQKGILHRDLNSNNILVYQENRDHKVKIIDFAFATHMNGNAQISEIPEGLQGTLAYISPEQTGRLRQRMDFRSDLYSLGVTFYEVFTGKLPFQQSEASELVHAHLAQVPLPPHQVQPEIPEQVSRIILRMLAKNPNERYQSASGLAADLSRCLKLCKSDKEIPLFPLGEQDRINKLDLPQKLYGRNEVLMQLQQTYERVAQGTVEMTLLKGYAGIGKSAIVTEIQKAATARNANFVSGSFELMEGNPPYLATNRALAEFVRLLLTESSSSLEAWKKRILDTVGENGKLMTDVIPELELIIGPQPEVTQVGTAEAQNRLKYTFFSFFKTLSDESHPMVLFVDNCQWADEDSIELLRLLVSDPDNQHLWVLAALRDNEVDDTHPMLQAVRRLQEEQARVEVVPLGNLGPEAVGELVADALNCASKNCLPLAEAIYGKTQGNPFFVRQILMSLHESGSLWFSAEKKQWQWDLNAVKQLNISDNVVELMAAKIQRLPRATQELLKLAACVGNRFSLSTLQALGDQNPARCITELNRAISEGLLADLTSMEGDQPEDLRYSFTHDRIRQAVYSLIPKEETPVLHLKIGRVLLANLPQENRESLLEEQIFDIVSQWNRGIDLVESKEDRRTLARLNYIAGKKATDAAGYKTALGYLSKGLELLAMYGWENNYALNYGLANEAVKAAYLDGNYSLLETLATRLINQSVNLVEKVKAYELSIQALIAQNQFPKAVDRGMKFLDQLGVSFPDKATRFTLAKAHFKIRWLLRNKSPKDLRNLPLMDDPLKVTAMRIISVIAPALFMSKPELMPFITFESIRLTLQHGISPLTAEAFVSYANILVNLGEDLDKAYPYGELALDLLQQADSEEYKARTFFSFYASLAPLKIPLRECLPPLLEGYQSGLKTGDLGSAGFCITFYVSMAYHSGIELPEVEKKIAFYGKELRQTGQEVSLGNTSLSSQVIQNLISPQGPPYVLKGRAFDEEIEIPKREAANDRSSLFSIYYSKMVLAYNFEDFEKAVEFYQKARQYHEPTTLLGFTQYPFYEALLKLAIYPNASRKEQKQLLLEIEKNLDYLSIAAENCPANNLHKYFLVEAERLRVQGDEREARDLYEQAIMLARENEYLNEEALAWELAGRFYREEGNRFLAETYLLKAWQTYKRYGAEAKTAYLEKRYPHFIAKPLRKGGSFSTGLRSTSSGEGLQGLDLETITKASLALSGEVVLSNLTEKMLQLAMENAGAERGVFIENRNGVLTIVAQGKVKQGIHLRENVPLEQSNAVPQTIVHYVARTRKELVLSNASDHTIYQKDPYVVSQQPKSVLCYPITHQGALSGLLYLENNLTEGTFTSDRIEILKVLAAQTAISIENARLYEHLDEKVRVRTEELNQKNKQLATTLVKLQSAQSQLVQSEKMASLGQLTSGVAHEINNPINFVSGNIGPLTRDIEDIKGLLLKIKDLENSSNIREALAKVKEYRDEIDADYLFEEIDMLLKGIRDGAMRTKEIVAGLKNFSRMDEDTFKIADVHEGIESTLTLLSNKIKNRVTIHQEFAKLPRIECLPGKINQVLMNILSNALDAIEGEGEIFIRTWQEGEMLKISIRDTGRGIAPEIRERIFDPFFTTKDVGEGTGLGLSISYGIIQQHHGTIEVESKLHEGSTFTITIPIRQEE